MTTKKGNDYAISLLKNHGWCIWMVLIYSMLGISTTDSIFWMTYIPLILLVQVSKNNFLSEKIKELKDNNNI